MELLKHSHSSALHIHVAKSIILFLQISRPSKAQFFLYVERRSPVLEVVVINMAVTVGFIADAEPGVNDGRDMTLSGEWWTLKQGAQAPNLRDFASG